MKRDSLGDVWVFGVVSVYITISFHHFMLGLFSSFSFGLCLCVSTVCGNIWFNQKQPLYIARERMHLPRLSKLFFDLDTMVLLLFMTFHVITYHSNNLLQQQQQQHYYQILALNAHRRIPCYQAQSIPKKSTF